jgi:hypothetical protein
LARKPVEKFGLLWSRFGTLEIFESLDMLVWDVLCPALETLTT